MGQVKWNEFEYDSANTPPSDITNILTYGSHTITLSNGVLLLGIDTKIYRSTNNGESYSNVKTFTNGHIIKFWQDGWTTGKCYVCEKGGNIWYSTDYGATWTAYEVATQREWYDIYQCPDASHQDLLAVYDGGAGTFYWVKWSGSAWTQFDSDPSTHNLCAGFQVDGMPLGAGLGGPYVCLREFTYLTNPRRISIIYTTWEDGNDFINIMLLPGGQQVPDNYIETDWSIDPYLNSIIKIYDDQIEKTDYFFSLKRISSGMQVLYYWNQHTDIWTIISEETNINSRYILPLSQDYSAGEFHYIATVKYDGADWTSKFYCFLENWSHQLSYLQSIDLFCYAIFPDPFFLATDTHTVESWYRHYSHVDKGIEIEGTDFKYKAGNITLGRIVTEREFVTNQTLIIYDSDDTLLFRGFMLKRNRNGDKFIYQLKSFDKEITQLKITKTYTDKTAEEIIIDLMTLTSFLYVNSSLSSFTTTYSFEFHNRTIRSILNTLMDLENGIWAVDPSGKLSAYSITDIIDSTIIIQKTTSIDSNNFNSIPKPTLIPAEYNKITLMGAIVSGARLQNESPFGNDYEAQLMNGIIEYVAHMPHLNTQAAVNSAADDLLARTGLSGNPLYINWSLTEEGYVQVAMKLQCQFTAYSEMGTLTYYYLLEYHYDPLDESAVIFCSSGLIQEGKVRESEIHQTSDADEEQIDILAVAGGVAGEPNTMSSEGSGISIYYQKDGINLELNAIKSENNRITITLDGESHDVEVTLVEANIVHDNISGGTATSAHHVKTTAGELNHDDLANIDTGDLNHLTDSEMGLLHVDQITTNAHVQAIITAEIVNGQSIDNAIDALILTHKNISSAHHTLYTLQSHNNSYHSETYITQSAITTHESDLGDLNHLSDSEMNLLHVDVIVSVANVETVITAELVNGQSIDAAIDALILTHKNLASAHHPEVHDHDGEYYTKALVDSKDDAHQAAAEITAAGYITTHESDLGDLNHLTDSEMGLLHVDQITTNAHVQALSINNLSEDASPQLAADLDGQGFGLVDCDRVHFRDNVNASIELEDHFTTDHRYHGITIDIENGNLAFGLPGYISANNTVARAYSGSLATMPCIGVSVGDNKMLIQGVIYDLTLNLAAGNPAYVTTAGILDDIVPNSVGDIVQVIGIAIDADTLLVNPSPVWVVRK